MGLQGKSCRHGEEEDRGHPIVKHYLSAHPEKKEMPFSMELIKFEKNVYSLQGRARLYPIFKAIICSMVEVIGCKILPPPPP